MGRPHRIYLIHENDAWRALPCPARTGSRHGARPRTPNEHLDEVRARDSEEVDAPPRRRSRAPSNVLQLPGGPTSSTPLGMRPPSFWNFCGSRRKNRRFSCKLFPSPRRPPGDVVEGHATPWASVRSLAFDFAQTHQAATRRRRTSGRMKKDGDGRLSSTIGSKGGQQSEPRTGPPSARRHHRDRNALRP